MNQTTDTHPLSDLGALRLQLEKDGKDYDDNSNSKESRKQLLHTLRTNDCREIITVVLDDDYLANVFLLAACQNHVDILEAFLDHGMNIDIKDKEGWTALMGASTNGQEESVRFLLDHNASVNVQNQNGNTALMYGSQSGKVKIVQLLLEKNANLDIQNNDGMTALMHASVDGNKEVVQLLLNHGADMDLKNDREETALNLADDEEIKELLRNHVNNSYVLK